MKNAIATRRAKNPVIMVHQRNIFKQPNQVDAHREATRNAYSMLILVANEREISTDAQTLL